MRPPAPVAKTRVYIVDGYGLIRKGLADLIRAQPDMEVCGEAEDAQSAFNPIMTLTPDIVTTEISLPGNSGLELIKGIRGLDREIGILVISMCDEYIYAERALRAGAHGFVSKHTGDACIPERIRKIRNGEFAFTPMVQDRICESLMQCDSVGRSGVRGLTDRELEIGSLIGDGISSREIATRLSVSIKTIETHRANLKVKLGLPNGTRLLQFWSSWVASERSGLRQSTSAGLPLNGDRANGATALLPKSVPVPAARI